MSVYTHPDSFGNYRSETTLTALMTTYRRRTLEAGKRGALTRPVQEFSEAQ